MSQPETSKLIEIMSDKQYYEDRILITAFTSLVAILYLFIIVFFMIALVMQGVLKPALVVFFIIICIIALSMRALFLIDSQLLKLSVKGYIKDKPHSKNLK